MTFSIKALPVARFLIGIVAILIGLHILGQISSFVFKRGSLFGFVELVNINFEANLPTFFSALILVFATILLAIIAACHKKNGTPHRAWAGLAAVILFLGIDEATEIHEKVGQLVPYLLKLPSVYFAWVLPYAILTLIFAVVFFRFVQNLPPKTRLLLMTSGAIYVFGALFLEILVGVFVETVGISTVVAMIIGTLEESLEMLGVILAIYTLLLYIENEFGTLQLSFANKAVIPLRNNPADCDAS